MSSTRKRVLVAGAGGMLGHCLVRSLREHHHVIATARRPIVGLADLEVRLCDLTDFAALEQLLDEAMPDAVVNCAGAIKQRLHLLGRAEVISVNSALPHFLASWCQDRGRRLIHVSTDCVFRGDRAAPPYSEDDATDAVDLYGYSKAAGEVRTLPAAVTLRTSIVGRELGSDRYGLLEWFLSRGSGEIPGYSTHWWSGVTTLELSLLIVRIIDDFGDLSGLFHVASEPVNKYDLLRIFEDVYRTGARIAPTEAVPSVYRALDGARLSAAIGYSPPDLVEQVKALCSLESTY